MGPLRSPRRGSSAAPAVADRAGAACLTLPQRTAVSVLLSVSAAAVVVGPTGLAARPAGWLLLGLAVLVGLHPLIRHALAGPHRGGLRIDDLDDRSARLVREAADEAATLRRLADRAPAGAVGDHLEHLAVTARGYVLALHQAAVQSAAAAPGRRDVELEAAMGRIVAQLADLSAAAARLREAQRRHLLDSPLDDLTAATDAMAIAIESGQLR